MLAWMHRNIPIVLATVLSLALHLAVLLPALGGLGAGAFDASALDAATDGAALDEDSSAPEADRSDAANDPAGARARRDARDALERRADNARRALQEQRDRQRLRPPELREPEVHLGIDESDAATMNWIGYAEYQRHLAELSEVEQAANRVEVASGSRGTASPLLPPAEPAPASAVSPNPSQLPLPAAAPGSDTAPPTNLVAQPQIEPASAAQPTPPTEASNSAGADSERARPLPAPEPTAAVAPATETSKGSEAPRTDPTPEESVTPTAPGGATPRPTPETNPANPIDPGIAPSVNPAEGVKPALPAPTPEATDPRAEPRTNPDEQPEPSKVEPERRLDPTPSGEDPAAPPREGADTEAVGIKPITEAPESTRDPNAPEKTADAPTDANPAADQSVSPATGTQGGGQSGAQPIDGAQAAPQTPSPAGAPGDTRSKTGELSDKESDPTSLIDVPMASWQNGRPLAAKGVVLKPVRPRFTTLNYVDGVGRNPIGELVIGRDGVPQTARILRSTGNPGVDEAIRSALFKWRGSGKALDKLAPGQTVTIRLKLIMLQD